MTDDDPNEHTWCAALSGIADPSTLEILSCDDEAATARIERSGAPSVLKAAIRGSAKALDLDAQWRVLAQLSAVPDFPGPRPLARHELPDGSEAIEIEFLSGAHPSFGSDDDFRIFGATIARLHRISRGLRIDGAPVWDFDRVVRHFDDPRLLALFSPPELEVARRALALFGPRYAAFQEAGYWTGLVHSDCHRHNVLIKNEAGRLIDFGETGFGVLFRDLGVAVADSVVDASDRAPQLRRALVEGYLSVLPEAAGVLQEALVVFEAMRSLEVMTWPVSDWTPERYAEEEDEARDNIEASIAQLRNLLSDDPAD